jgi:hypothetical protein
VVVAGEAGSGFRDRVGHHINQDGNVIVDWNGAGGANVGDIPTVGMERNSIMTILLFQNLVGLEGLVWCSISILCSFSLQ